ncbi:MAG: hypothetical protein AABW61_03030 [Candidatus Aenigmatarchaeota archaeon]
MWSFNILFKNEDRKSSSEILEHDIKSIKEKLLSRIADVEKPFIEKGLGKHSEILPVVASIESGLGTFDDSAVGSAEMDPRLFQILTSNKTIISKKIHDLCKGLKLLTGNDIDSIMTYYKNSYSAISDTISNSVNNYEKIEDYLDRQVIPIFRNVNYVAGLLESFKREIENFQLKHAKMKSLENLINKFEIQIPNKENLINRKLLLEKELENLEKEKISIGTQLNELINTNEYKEFSKLIGMTEVLKQDLDKNRMIFLNYMSVLGRPIKKFMKLVGDKEVAFDQGKDLTNFLDNQELTRENILLIRATVEKMGSVMEKLSLKEENRTKTLNRMKEILDGKMLDELYEEKLKIRNKLEDVEKLIVLRTPDKKFELGEKLGKTNSNIGSVKNDLTIIEKDAAGIGKVVEESKQRLEYEFKEIFNEDIHIKVK